MSLAVANGLYFSFSVFLVPLIEEFRWSRGLTAGALSLSTIVQGVLAPVAGVLVDRFGPRRVILTGVVVLSTASVLSSTIRSPWELYGYTGLLAAAGLVGLGPVPMGVLLSRWFTERRGRAVGIAFSGMGFGVFVTGPLAQWLIATFGWRVASATLGLGALLILLPLAWLGAHDPPSSRREEQEPHAEPGTAPAAGWGAPERRSGTPSSRPQLEELRFGRAGDAAERVPPTPRLAPYPTLSDALGARAFWALWLAYLFTPLAVFPVTTHQVAFAIDTGFAPLVAATVFGVTGLMSSAGRVLFGLAADRVGGALAATVSFACTAGGALSLLALDVDRRAGWLVVYAILFGLGFGARGPIITAMASDLFGGRRFGVIYGAMNIGNGLGGAIGPWFGGFVHDVTGSYRVAFLASVVFCACGAACFWLARRRAP
jgi:MFS family permease